MKRVDASIRISAILAIVVGALYAQGLFLSLRSGAGDGTWPIIAIGVAMPMVPGVLALMGRMPSLLLLAWGWVLGVYLPKLLSRLLVPAMPGVKVLYPAPDRSGIVMVSLALAGLALYFLAVYRQRGEH
jgi:hypothetical protein